MSKKTMQWVLFCVFVFIFVATAGITVSGLVLVWWFETPIENLPYLKWLIGLTIAEVCGGVVALFYSLFGLRREGTEKGNSPKSS